MASGLVFRGGGFYCMAMKSFRQRLKSASHLGMRWFVRLRMPVAVGFVLVFGVLEMSRHYRTNLLGLPAAIGQDLSDWYDDAFLGEGYLQKDPAELKAKADAGNAFAQYVYALRKTSRPPAAHRILPEDLTVSRTYYAAAAKQGMARAEAVMALYLQRGLGGPVDLSQAKVYAQRAADNQEPMGMRLLADLLLDEAKKSLGGNRELEQRGYRWLIKAAERGNRGAMRKLGDLYAEGRIGFTDEAGDPILVQNFEQALAWYEQAALARDFEACTRLSAAFDDNVIAPIDTAKAYAWTLVAVQLATKSEDAEKLKAKLKEQSDRLPPADLTSAQNLARAILIRMPTEKEDAERALLKAR